MFLSSLKDLECLLMKKMKFGSITMVMMSSRPLIAISGILRPILPLEDLFFDAGEHIERI